MRLSDEAINDLKKTLLEKYGQKIVEQFNEEDFLEIGMLLLTILAESLKQKIHREPSTLGQ